MRHRCFVDDVNPQKEGQYLQASRVIQRHTNASHKEAPAPVRGNTKRKRAGEVRECLVVVRALRGGRPFCWCVSCANVHVMSACSVSHCESLLALNLTMSIFPSRFFFCILFAFALAASPLFIHVEALYCTIRSNLPTPPSLLPSLPFPL
jgi:hypothetical protein